VRKIVVGGLLSLDGVAEDPNRRFTERDDVVDASTPDSSPRRMRSSSAVAADDDSSTGCRRSGWNRSEARPRRLAICLSTIALFVNGRIPEHRPLSA
jgi:hypothetical protein